ncbi:MAG TPA: hypothetical protein VH184_11765 [Dongiaceae bacterium]|jgi:hypothetical protein|nr:hypothetical protein [Dongiaceae bacterium]
MLEKKDILEAVRKMELAARESDHAVLDVREQFARVEAMVSQLEAWRRPLMK